MDKTPKTPKKPQGSKRRAVSDEELDLWFRVTRSIEPLERGPEGDIRPDISPARPAGKGAREAPRPSQSHSRPATGPDRPRRRAGRTGPGKPPDMGPRALDRRTVRRLASGQLAIEAVLDLHGLRQREAHVALKAFLLRAQASGHRFVKVITGKGTARGDNDNEEAPFDLYGGEPRGVLKRLVPAWLGEPQFTAIVVGYSPAGRSHGGEGAYYIQLRRIRPAPSHWP